MRISSRLTTLAALFVCGTLTRVAYAQPADPPPAPPEPPPEPPPAAPTPPPPPPPAPPAPPPAPVAPEKPKHEMKFPVAYVDRPLTLPKLVLSPSLDFTYDRFLTAAGNLGIGLSLGASDDVTLDMNVNVPLQSAAIPAIHQYAGGAMFRFFHSDIAEIGGRVELGVISVDAPDPDSPLLRGTLALPVVVHAAHVVRLETGIAFSGVFPIDGNRRPDGGITTYGSDPNIVGPGVPIEVTIQIIEPLFAGIDTGIGMLTFQGNAVDRGFFAPLGFRFGGTVPMDHRPLLDVVGNFGFPTFLIAIDSEPPVSEIWQVGLSVKAYAPL